MAETLGVGLLGLGTVGSAVAARLMSEWELLAQRAGATPVLRRVAVRDATRKRDIDLRAVPITDDPASVVDDPTVSVVVEVMGGVDPATTLIQRALERGKSVVTANKAVIAESGPQLAELAAAHGAGIWFEASVGAGLPVVSVLRESLGGDRITAIDAIINGTTNVILTRMRTDGVAFETALAEAQRRGFAEADPSSDVDGWDAAYKLIIMSWLAYGAHATASGRFNCPTSHTQDSSATASSCSLTRSGASVRPQCIFVCVRRSFPAGTPSSTSMILPMLSSSRATWRDRSRSPGLARAVPPRPAPSWPTSWPPSGGAAVNPARRRRRRHSR
jgi:homoserine dehydrogenase